MNPLGPSTLKGLQGYFGTPTRVPIGPIMAPGVLSDGSSPIGGSYRGTSLIKTRPPLGPYSRPMP
ncbi:hypothetical protein T484DRAFT_1951425, partial [Baffinella frigidus]